MVRLNTSHFDIPDPEMLIDYQTPETPPKSLLRRSVDGFRGFLTIVLVITGGVVAAAFMAALLLLIGLASALCVAVFIIGAAVSLVFVVPGVLIAPGAVTILGESMSESRNTPN